MPLVGVPTSGPSTAGVSSWPLVGRTRELEAARRALAEPGAGLVIAGPPGVGRTRLAEEVLADVEADGATVVRLVATRAAATIPFWAAAPLLGGPGSDGPGGTSGRDNPGGPGNPDGPDGPDATADALMSAHRAV